MFRTNATILLMSLSLMESFGTHAFWVVPVTTSIHRRPQQQAVTLGRFAARGVVSRLTNDEETTILSLQEENNENISNDREDDEDIAFLFEHNNNDGAAATNSLETEEEVLDIQEQVWRYAKKPLLRIGSKGATHAHGNSLRQLLEDHTIVKVKVNTKKFNNSVEEAFETLRQLAIENGASPELELIQLREHSKEILFGMPGTLQRIEDGTFPPPRPVLPEDNGDDIDSALRA